MSESTAAERLTQALVLVAEGGGRTPCQGGNRNRWTSDETAEQELAAAACAPCPLMDSCAAAARELKATAGVWAGVPHDFKTYSRKRSAA